METTLSRAATMRKQHYMSRLIRLDAMQGLVGEHHMGDYICFGGEMLWLSEDEAFDVIDLLSKYQQKRIQLIEQEQTLQP